MFGFQTATLYPGVVSAVCFVLNFFIWGQHSSGAVINLLINLHKLTYIKLFCSLSQFYIENVVCSVDTKTLC